MPDSHVVFENMGAMAIKFRAFGTRHDNPSSGGSPGSGLPDDAQTCYDSLFTVDEEREEFADIVEYIRHGHDNPATDWAELLVIMQDDGVCVGIAFLSLYRPLKWWFGNYYGVEPQARAGCWAADFLADVRKRCLSIMYDAKGIVFEVEPYSDEEIQPILDKLKSRRSGSSVTLNEDEDFALTAVRRIKLYTTKGLGYGPASSGKHVIPTCARVLWSVEGNSRQPVDYIQPGMKPPLEATQIHLWLMVQPFPALGWKITQSPDPDNYDITDTEAAEIFDLIYDHVFPSAYAKEYKLAFSKEYRDNAPEVSSLEGYGAYASQLKKKVLATQTGRRIVLRLEGSLSSKADTLVLLASAAGL
jgi:hypothetical protein